MIVEEALVKQIESTATITAIIGTSPVRLYPMMPPQTPTLPLLTYQRISSTRPHLHNLKPTGQATVRVQLTCWAADYTGAKALATAVRQAFDGWHGILGGTGGIEAGIMLDNDRDDIDVATGRWFVPIDVFVTHQEA